MLENDIDKEYLECFTMSLNTIKHYRFYKCYRNRLILNSACILNFGLNS